MSWEIESQSEALRKLLPFVTPRKEQVHITESYISVPPALIITDEYNQVWTLGMSVAPQGKSPDGEFAFPILRNGFEVDCIASRLERRNGKVRAFTRDGWRTWSNRFNSFM